MLDERLAIDGGCPYRNNPWPCRKLFGEEELQAVQSVFHHAWDSGQDFGFQGVFEEEYTKAFSAYYGGGYADGVCSGSVANFSAMQALNLPKGSDVIVSPVTDPGGIAPVILAGHQPVIADAIPGSYNIGPEEFEQAITPNTKAALIAHIGGIPLPMTEIMAIANHHNIKVVEDCSQAHGAQIDSQYVGTFGHLATFSTMYSKMHATGGCGGVVFTRDKDLYWNVRSCADRGKVFSSGNIMHEKNPSLNLFPALNVNMDELSAAIGMSTLKRLPEMVARRQDIVDDLQRRFKSLSSVQIVHASEHVMPSWFFVPICVDESVLCVDKRQFAIALAKEGVWINPHYPYVVSEWDWMMPYISDHLMSTPNAVRFRNTSFNLLFHEQFLSSDLDDIMGCFQKIESHYLKG